jgi:hypothetical protein
MLTVGGLQLNKDNNSTGLKLFAILKFSYFLPGFGSSSIAAIQSGTRSSPAPFSIEFRPLGSSFKNRISLDLSTRQKPLLPDSNPDRTSDF